MSGRIGGDSLGNAWFLQGNYVKAVADFDEAVRPNPRDVGAVTPPGVARCRLGEFDRAERDFEKTDWQYQAVPAAARAKAGDFAAAVAAGPTDRSFPIPSPGVQGLLQAAARAGRGSR